ncbi:hypothetical protein HK405_012564, partial [Cladochytrium tenue]
MSSAAVVSAAASRPAPASAATTSASTVAVSVVATCRHADLPRLLRCEAWASTDSPNFTPYELRKADSASSASVAGVDPDSHAVLQFEGHVPVTRNGEISFRFVVAGDGGVDAFEWIADGETATVTISDSSAQSALALQDVIDIVGAASVTVDEVPRALDASDASAQQWLLRWQASDAAAADSRPELRVRDMRRHVLVERAQLWWLEPRAGAAAFATETNRDIQLALALRPDARYVLLVPFPPTYLRACTTDTLALDWSADLASPLGHGCLVACGRDPEELLDRAAKTIQRDVLGEPRDLAPLPDVATAFPPSQIWDHFAWCTWDAFYKEVTADKILAGLREFRAMDVPVDVVLIDDGWQDFDTPEIPYKQRLVSIEPDYTKFPNGLDICRVLKEEHGVKYV